MGEINHELTKVSEIRCSGRAFPAPNVALVTIHRNNWKPVICHSW